MKIEEVNDTTYHVTEVKEIVQETLKDFKLNNNLLPILTIKVLQEMVVYRIVDLLIQQKLSFKGDYPILTVKIPSKEMDQSPLEGQTGDIFLTIAKLDAEEQSYTYGILDN